MYDADKPRFMTADSSKYWSGNTWENSFKQLKKLPDQRWGESSSQKELQPDQRREKPPSQKELSQTGTACQAMRWQQCQQRLQVSLRHILGWLNYSVRPQTISNTARVQHRFPSCASWTPYYISFVVGSYIYVSFKPRRPDKYACHHNENVLFCTSENPLFVMRHDTHKNCILNTCNRFYCNGYALKANRLQLLVEVVLLGSTKNWSPFPYNARTSLFSTLILIVSVQMDTWLLTPSTTKVISRWSEFRRKWRHTRSWFQHMMYGVHSFGSRQMDGLSIHLFCLMVISLKLLGHIYPEKFIPALFWSVYIVWAHVRFLSRAVCVCVCVAGEGPEVPLQSVSKNPIL